MSSRLPALLACVLATGCHTLRTSEETTRGETRRVARDEPPRALPPRVELGDDGRLRLIEPLVCGHDSVTDVDVIRVSRRTPNMATLVVGVIATAAGAVALVSGASGDDPGGSPLTYLGPAAIVGGAPLAVGPLLGNTTSRRLLDTRQVRAPSDDERCGERPVAATRATLGWSGLRAVGAVDGDGRLAISPFAFVDAFAVSDAPPLALTVDVERSGDARLALEAVIEPRDLIRAQPGFLAAAGIDATVLPIRKVPRFELGVLTVVRTGPPGARALEATVQLRNVGPGDGFAVRLVLSSPHPELDGRVLYVGRLPSRVDRDVTLAVPISDEADRALARADLTVSARLKDAYDAAPDTPSRFSGRVREK